MTDKSHARTKIRTELRRVLNGLGTTQQEVDAPRIFRWLQSTDFKALDIRTPRDELDEEARVMGTREIRVLTIEIIASVKKADEVEILIDDICREVKAKLIEEASTAGGALRRMLDIVQHSADEIDFSFEGDQRSAVARMTYLGLYQIDAADPSTIIEWAA